MCLRILDSSMLYAPYILFFFFFFPDLSPNDIQDAVNIFQVKYTPFEEV